MFTTMQPGFVPEKKLGYGVDLPKENFKNLKKKMF
jgi:hypothetical protein